MNNLHYAVFTYNDGYIFTPDAVEQLLTDSALQFVRVGTSESVINGIYLEDYDLSTANQNLIYIYLNDKSVTPFHSNTDITQLMLERLGSHYPTFELTQLTNGNHVIELHW